MIEGKILTYKRAYVELYEFIKALNTQEQQKIPQSFIANLRADLDKNYSFEFDKTKNIAEQDYMVETKALIVKLYERYLAPSEEREFWKKYDYECWKIIENKKEKKYSYDNIFNNRQKIYSSGEETALVKVDNTKNNNWLKKIIKMVKKILDR